jgi:ABC-2 type transport system ATP-binding protein
MIQVEGLTKDYGSRRAIDHLTFHAKRGEVLGFLGPNGAGKTTTMRILSGYMPPTQGKAIIGGFDVLRQSLEVRKLVGYLPETVPLYPEMTVSAYLQYMADLRHLSDAKGRVEEVLRMVHMEDRAKGLIGKLSKGMRQRIGLAQALLHQPQVLILDEPTIGLDPVQIKEVRSLIQDIGKERTVLLSTHILSEAQQVCDRVLIINKGRIVTEDTPAQLQHRLTGAQRIQLTLMKDIEKLEGILSKVNGVLDFSRTGNGKYEFSITSSFDPRPELARQVISAGGDLLELKELSISLEDIFIELTRETPPDPVIANDLDNEAEEVLQ